jgi:hypothetical protein
MDWILYAAFICGIVGLGYGLKICGVDLKQVYVSACVEGSFGAILKDALKLAVIGNLRKVVLGFITALLLVAHLERPSLSLFLASFFISWAPGLVCITVCLEATRPSGRNGSRPTGYMSDWGTGFLIMGFELSCLAGCMLISSLAHLDYHQTQTVFLGMGFGFCVAASLFYRSSPGYSEPGPTDSGSEPDSPSNQQDHRPFALWDYESDAAVSAAIFRGYAGITVVASRMGAVVYGTKAAAFAPLLIGATSLAACMVGSVLWGTRVAASKNKWGAVGMLCAVSILACFLAGAALYYVGDLIQAARLEPTVFPMPWTNLMEAAVIGVLLTWIVALVTAYLSSKMVSGPWATETERTQSLPTSIRLSAISSLLSVFPYAVAAAALGLAYHLGENAGEYPNPSFSVAIACVSMIAISGTAFAPTDAEIRVALTKLYNVTGIVLCGILVRTYWVFVIDSMSHEPVTFDLSSPTTVIGLILGGITPYLAVILIIVIAVKGVRSLIREAVARAGKMR